MAKNGEGLTLIFAIAESLPLAQDESLLSQWETLATTVITPEADE